jgi:tRNA(Ile)-lysidine synthase
MASSRKSRSTEAPASLGAVVAAAIEHEVQPGDTLVTGLSGGVDSVVLLHALRGVSDSLGFLLRAVHVNHGLSANASRWADFCRELCASMNVPVAIEDVDVAGHREQGREGAARAARYAALSRQPGRLLALAHHRDDQAETLLLQLLRGSGAHGLAAMPASAWLGDKRVLRPLLAVSRREIVEYARREGLAWVEDESNEDVALDRNFVRHRLMPAMEERFPGASQRIARSASHLAESAALLEVLGMADVEAAGVDGGLSRSRVQALGPARAKNALRTLCRRSGVAVPHAAALEEFLRQLQSMSRESAPRLDLGDWSLLAYRDRIGLERPFSGEGFSPVDWSGEGTLPLLGLGGVLRFKPVEGRGLNAARLRAEPLTVRVRRGGERLRIHPRRPSRTLKNLFQEKGTPPWRRVSVPLLYCGETLVHVPGVGTACGWEASKGAPGLIVSWEPLDAAPL